MSMIVKRIALKRIGHQKETCPRCYRTKVGVMRDNGWLKWYVITMLPSFHMITHAFQSTLRTALWLE